MSSGNNQISTQPKKLSHTFYKERKPKDSKNPKFNKNLSINIENSNDENTDLDKVKT